MSNYDKFHNWSICAGIGILFSIIDFIIMINQEDGSSGAVIFAVILLFGIVFTIISVVQVNVYNAKIKNMSADEYLSDRFSNAIPEAKALFGIKDKNLLSGKIQCPYCKSNNVKKITTLNRAVSTSMVGIACGKIGKQWHCNSCNSMS